MGSNFIFFSHYRNLTPSFHHLFLKCTCPIFFMLSDGSSYKDGSTCLLPLWAMSTEGRRFYSFSYPQSLVQGIVHDVYSIDIYIFTKRCIPRYLVKGRKKREKKGVRRKEKRKSKRKEEKVEEEKERKK